MAITSTALLLGSLAAGALSAGIGAGVAANKNKKARQEEQNAYNRSKLALDADLYRSPFDSYSNKLLLKKLDERVRDINDAEDNRAVAGGATMENRLAARDSSNKIISDTYDNALVGEDARQQAIRNQLLALDNQHSQNVANSYMQDANNWQQWGSNMSNAFMQLGTSAYMGGGMQPLLNKSQKAADQAYMLRQKAAALNAANPTPQINMPGIPTPAAIRDGKLNR